DLPCELPLCDISTLLSARHSNLVATSDIVNAGRCACPMRDPQTPPPADIDGLSALTVARLLVNVMGTIARQV
ncbi:hypothetical protein, partial [Mesorhizobium sp. WSM4315]|uniref:hypothetical protein n=1 Tax=Mesorhizobium sp. WSM4315 TaxID=2589882 RepID=UPI001AEDC76D